MKKKGSLPKVSVNSPVVLGFAGICLITFVLNLLTGGASNRALFSVYRASFGDVLAYFRVFGHVFGHADWEHLINNMLYILILGPLLEEKYGSRSLIMVMLAAALTTGLIHLIFFPRFVLLGASGIVFAFILLSSITAVDGKSIPLTFLLVAVLYLGQQLYEGIFVNDNISQLTHIAGGAVGTAAGFILAKKKRAGR